jgi:DivIVA domain-containing protein
MALTAKQVEEVSFRGSIRGYDRNEVDAFLDHVAVTLSRMEGELGRLQQERDAAVAHAASTEQRHVELDAAIGARIDAAVQKAIAEADG